MHQSLCTSAPDTTSEKFVFSLTCATWMGSCSPATRAMCALSSLRAGGEQQGACWSAGCLLCDASQTGRWWVALRRHQSKLPTHHLVPAPFAVILSNLLACHGASLLQTLRGLWQGLLAAALDRPAGAGAGLAGEGWLAVPPARRGARLAAAIACLATVLD